MQRCTPKAPAAGESDLGLRFAVPTASPKPFPPGPGEPQPRKNEISNIFLMCCHPENTEALPKSWCGVVGVHLPHPRALHRRVLAPTAPAPHSQSFVLLSERRERMFCGRVRGGESPIKWPKVPLRWRFLHGGKPLEPLLSPPLNTTFTPLRKRARGREGVRICGGDSKHPPGTPLCPSSALHVPASLPGQTARHPTLHPPPAPAANTTRVSQRLDFFFPLAGDTAELLVPAINPEQLKQQEDNDVVPATLPRLLCYHLGRGAGGAAPLPLRGPSARNPRHPGWGEEDFLFHCEEGAISLSSLSLSPDVELPRFAARNSFPISSPSHVPEERAEFPPPTILKTIREILGREESQLETCCAWPEDPSRSSCRFPKSRL